MSRDPAYLLDIYQEAELLQQFTLGIDLEAFSHDQLRQRAVERSITIIGEAARRLSDEFRANHADIPWKQIIGMRNVLVHDYDDIQLAVVWQVIQNDIPALIRQIAPLIPSDEDE